MPTVNLYAADCRQILPFIEDGSVDAVVTDPPSGIAFMGKDWDRDRGGRSAWVGWLTDIMIECLRVAKPGARMLCWAIPRTSHWTATAIEDAGWIVEDRIAHIFGQGFPKAKSKLKPAVEDWWLARKPGRGVPALAGLDACRVGTGKPRDWREPRQNGVAGAALGVTLNGSVAVEPTTLGRWPANLVLGHSPECRRVGTKRVKGSNGVRGSDTGNTMYGSGKGLARPTTGQPVGYADPDGTEEVESWSCADGCPVAELDRQSGASKSGRGGSFQRELTSRGYKGGGIGQRRSIAHDPIATEKLGYADSGGASRFFYVAKASRADRGAGNNHPTAKSTVLMSWLCRLITPDSGLVLDPFCGSGSTIKAAFEAGYSCIGIDQEPAYVEIARRRLDQTALPLIDGVQRVRP